MKLACNYYLETLELLKEEKIDIDYLKLPTLSAMNPMLEQLSLRVFSRFMKELQKLRPVLIHGLYPCAVGIGAADFTQRLNIPQVKKTAELSEVKGISLHLCGVDTSLSDCENKMILLDNIKFLREMVFPDLDFFTLENVDGNPYMPQNNFGVCINPVFISEIVNESGCGFLLDISHAYCSAKCMDIDFWSYIKLLPMDSLYEIHINGWIETPDNIMAHVKIHEEAYEILEKIMETHKPEILTLEYGREDDRIGAGIPTMSANAVNIDAKNDFVEQVRRLRLIMEKYS